MGHEIMKHTIERSGVDTIVSRPEPMASGQDLALISLFERLATDPTIPLDRIEKLMEMQNKLRADRAKELFMIAMANAQSEMKMVIADKSNNQTHSKYASYAALDNAVRPIYTKYGFSVTFDTAECDKPEYIRIVADVSNSGHDRRYHMDMPCDGKGAKGGDVMTKTHAVMSAASYGKRGLLVLIFNIPVADKWDDDGNAASGKSTALDTLSPEQVKTIRAALEITDSNVEQFLKIAKVERLEDIYIVDFDACMKVIKTRGKAHA